MTPQQRADLLDTIERNADHGDRWLMLDLVAHFPGVRLLLRRDPYSPSTWCCEISDAAGISIETGHSSAAICVETAVRTWLTRARAAL